MDTEETSVELILANSNCLDMNVHSVYSHQSIRSAEICKVLIRVNSVAVTTEKIKKKKLWLLFFTKMAFEEISGIPYASNR